jgi:carotenoid 1,2-hydratase
MTMAGAQQNRCAPAPDRESGWGVMADDPALEDLGFARPVPPGGYAWWYLDAISDDGREALSLIAFVGSVFSPYYAWSGRRDAEAHCAVNLALYSPRSARWTMTERGSAALNREPRRFALGRSSLTWDGSALTADIDELAFPRMTPVRGKLRVVPEALYEQRFTIDREGKHGWWPIAPRVRIEAHFEKPALTWQGWGYMDCNWGSLMLEQSFSRWDWSRGAGAGRDYVLYDTWELGDGDGSGATRSLALAFDRKGGIEPFEPPPEAPLPATLWRVPRRTRSEDPARTRVRRTLLDAPFYARSELESVLGGEAVHGTHESLALTRFANPLVKLMLPFRMPRRA